MPKNRKQPTQRTVRVPVENLQDIFTAIAEHKPFKRDVVCVPVEDIVEIFNSLAASRETIKQTISRLNGYKELLNKNDAFFEKISDTLKNIRPK